MRRARRRRRAACRGYSDEWADVLADAEKLARFASLVNAPDAPDPTVRFETVRGQNRPAGPVLVAGPTLEVVR